MKAIQTALILTGLCLSTAIFAAQPMDKEAAKQAALDICLAEATERYGTASAVSKPKKKRIGKMSGYRVTLKVGKSNKSIHCLADANGETSFYTGPG